MNKFDIRGQIEQMDDENKRPQAKLKKTTANSKRKNRSVLSMASKKAVANQLSDKNNFYKNYLKEMIEEKDKAIQK